ncbi:MAG: DNA photolyase family protein [Cyanobacteria bacterium]|nr:DNA photolyase family protein [Cyanobacteriota bacterium]MDW8202383.1 deoxyribodipyrimidine photo-lyase [Cyanobacteriota bacterium SKYGB_h_bin112]
MTTTLALFWHRKDLRLSDNLGLTAATQRYPRVVGVFCLDPTILARDDVAHVRVAYMMGCLAALKHRYQQAGSDLLILRGQPETAIPKLAKALTAQAVCWNLDIEPYAQTRDRAVESALKTLKITVHTTWDQLLHAPGTILTGNNEPYTVYTPFWRNVSKQAKAQPAAPNLAALATGLSDIEHTQAVQAGVIPLPTVQELGYHWDRPFILEPGEQPAQARLAEFCHVALADYQEQRNFPAQPGTSLLSPALKFGAIGIRTLWAATVTALEQSRSSEAEASIRVWQQELVWREFYQHVMYFFPQLADGPYRSSWQSFAWENNPDHFQAWCTGQTGYPIVDAAMHQLNETGWMHNRCRMIVASFLTKDLIIDWRWGEKYFMQRLIDGDLAANNGGWQWSASSGMDPRPLRIFNPASQAQKFDAEADYIRRWLPNLRYVETEALITGKIAPLERERCNYPPPIVDHTVQQKRFKQLYQASRLGNPE